MPHASTAVAVLAPAPHPAPDAPVLLTVSLAGERDPKLKLVPHILGIYQTLAAAGFGVGRLPNDEAELFRQRPGVPVVEVVAPSDLSRHVDELLFSAPLPVPAQRVIEVSRESWPRLLYDDDDGTIRGVKPAAAVEAVNQFGRQKIFNKHNFSQLPQMELPRHRHGATWARYYYQNGFVTLHRGAAPQWQPLSELPHAIRADALRPRALTLLPRESLLPAALPDDFGQPDPARTQTPGWRGRDFIHFLWLISATLPSPDAVPTPNAAKLHYLLQLLGFLLHDFRQQGRTDFAVVICDDEAGGTGKGMLIQTIKHLVTICEIDAKNVRSDFAPSDLGPQTRVKIYNDITQAWKFEHAYNEITDEQKIRQMHRGEVSVPYIDGWKVLITSNWLVRGTKDSDLRRQQIFDMTLFFNARRRPGQLFGHSFFSTDWDADDWLVYDNTMLYAVQTWLDCAYQPAVYVSADFHQRRIEAEYPELLRTYLDSIQAGCHETGKLYRDFMAQQSVRENRFLKDYSSTNFGRKAVAYFIDTGRNPVKNASKTTITISAVKAPPPPAGDTPF